MKTILQIFPLISLVPTLLFSQLFEPQPLIQLPGLNVKAQATPKGMIAWLNINNDTTSIMAKQIFPEADSSIVLFASINPIHDLEISSNSSTDYDVIWTELEDTGWQIKRRYCYQDSLADVEYLITDRDDTIKITGDEGKIFWSMDGYIYEIIVLHPWEQYFSVVVDSAGCENAIFRGNRLVYEKQVSDSIVIKSQHWSSSDQQWEAQSTLGWAINRFPSIGPNGGVTFQTFQDSVWRIGYQSDYTNWETTENTGWNYRYPMQFVFDIPLRDVLHDFLLVFESDSIPGNTEIMGILQSPIGLPDSTINISNATGNDTRPQIVEYQSGYSGLDSSYVAVFWEHETTEGTEIWWAKTAWELIYGSVGQDASIPNRYTLGQNYPNPFNSGTQITYTIQKKSRVQIVIYDLLGNRVATLVNEIKNPGIYSFTWEPKTVSSGVYFYQLIANGQTQTRKCVYLK